MEHSLENHESHLNRLCRICAGVSLRAKFKKQGRKQVLCERYHEDIFVVYGIDVTKDEEDIHPKGICRKCVDLIRIVKQRRREVARLRAFEVANKTKTLWGPFDSQLSIQDCRVCCQSTSLDGRFKTTNPMTISSSVVVAAETSVIAEESSQLQVSKSSVDESIMDQSLLDQPLFNSTPQSHDISDLDEHPTCSRYSDQPSIRIWRPFDTTPIKKTKDAETSMTPQKPENTPDSISHVKTSGNRKRKQPQPSDINEDRKKIALEVLKEMFKSDPVATFKQRGGNFSVMKISVPRTDSETARTPTKRKRVRLMERIRGVVAGKNNESIDVQTTSELKKIPMKKRCKIVEEAGIQGKAVIQQDDALIMKESMGLSWRQLRKQRSIMKNSGIKIKSEKAIRNKAKEIPGNIVSVDDVDFIGEEGLTSEKPFAYVNNIKELLEGLLDSYSSKGLIVSHQGKIPDDEVWVKFGGDHWKESFKLTVQVLNIEKPNVTTNTVVIGLAYVKDSYQNLELIMEKIEPQLHEIANSTGWKNKKTVVFLNGDYEFLTKMYGLSGPQGTFPCLWCTQPRRCFSSKAVIEYPHRTLEGIKQDVVFLMEQHDGDKKHAAKFRNCLRWPLIQIPLTHIAPPYLHIMLGIVVRHHRLLEQAVDKLDERIVIEEDRCLSEKGKSFKKFGKNWRNKRDIKNQIKKIKSSMILCDEEIDKITYRLKLRKLKRNYKALSFAALTPRSGPICSALDRVLAAHKITPQAYHSRAFVGNHCHKYMNADVIEALMNSIMNETCKHTSNLLTIDLAGEIKATFTQLNKIYKSLHDSISHSQPIAREETSEIQVKIDEYLAYFRAHFANTIIPKQHILEHHCLPFILQFGIGLGLHGEQGTEASHQFIAKLDKRMCGIRNESQRIKQIMDANILHSSPRLHGQGKSKRKCRK